LLRQSALFGVTSTTCTKYQSIQFGVTVLYSTVVQRTNLYKYKYK
jgi:hypothetical protein